MKSRNSQRLSTGGIWSVFNSFKRSAMATFAVLLLAAIASTILPVAADTPVSWTVYHSWNSQQKFVKRGTITWNKEESSNSQEPSSSKNDEPLLEVVNDKALSAKDVADMLEYGWYHVKLVPSSSKENDSDAVLNTVPACHVRRSNFKDLFELTLPRSVSDDKHQDAVTSFAYTPLISPLAPKTCDEYPDFDKEEAAFQSRSNVVLDTPGLPLKPILSTSKPPPGLKFMKRPKTAGDAGTAGGGGSANDGGYEDPNENAKPEPPSGPFGFLQKYWYVILPMVLMQFMTAPPPEEGQPQGQPQEGAQDAAAPGSQQGQQGGGGQAAVAAPSPGGGSGKKGRRGKRS